jgi:hypothetical protein
MWTAPVTATARSLFSDQAHRTVIVRGDELRTSEINFRPRNMAANPVHQSSPLSLFDSAFSLQGRVTAQTPTECEH